jgi:hypothetical protein
MQIEMQREQASDNHIPAVPVFEQHECHVELIGWACLHCGSHVETTRRQGASPK